MPSCDSASGAGGAGRLRRRWAAGLALLALLEAIAVAIHLEDLIDAPGFQATPERDGTRSEAFIILNFAQRLVLIGGTSYAGEIKKSVFTAMFLLPPPRGVLLMHTDAQLGRYRVARRHRRVLRPLRYRQDHALGRARAYPHRDDEHGWSSHSVFNFEDSYYAKVIRLDPTAEPDICRRMSVKAGPRI